MANGYSAEDLLDFLSHAADRGLMPAATSQALAVACRNMFGIMDEKEKADLRQVDPVKTAQRFNTKRAKDFSPKSLKEYGNRLARAVELFLRWRDDPANFSVKTRSTKASRSPSARKHAPTVDIPDSAPADPAPQPTPGVSAASGGYQTSIPVRAGVVVTISNVPKDLTTAEADRLAGFIKLLAVH
ncbi:MAG TPA: hypothetical protein VFN22_07845 [Gemmatimonadales bacterium]|nr:hypothetical protein [Gemmatimonadales bacterium]